MKSLKPSFGSLSEKIKCKIGMNKFLHMLILSVAAFSANAATKFSPYKGVWSSDNAEAVLTDSICIFYCRTDSTMQAFLEIPTAGIASETIFAKDGTVTTSSGSEPLVISEADGMLNLGGYSLKKVEDIKIVSPYELERCRSKFDIGRCLQQWRLGAGYGVSEDGIYCEINTNRHMFVYMINPSMVYIRAAAVRNNNSGTLFFQNIRMMKNGNTDEYTMYMEPRNFTVSRNDLEIDNRKFQPNSCTFDPDGGIYWSLISFEPDLILLNGCGETYQVKRHPIESDLEYFEYIPYSADGNSYGFRK